MWDIVKGYARRVRYLSFRAGELDPLIISYVFSRLESPSDSPYLLPRIRRIYCFAMDNAPAFLSIIRMMPPDSLQAIRLRFDTPSRSSPATVIQVFNFLSARPFRCLRSIVINGVSVAEEDSLEALASVVQLQSSLQTLELHHCRLSPKSLSGFTRKTQLSDLNMRIIGSLHTVSAMLEDRWILVPQTEKAAHLVGPQASGCVQSISFGPDQLMS